MRPFQYDESSCQGVALPLNGCFEMKWLLHSPMSGPSERLDQIQNLVGQQKFQEPRVAKVHRVEVLFAIFFEILLENRLEAGKFVVGKDVLMEQRVAVAVVLLDLGGRQAPQSGGHDDINLDARGRERKGVKLPEFSFAAKMIHHLRFLDVVTGRPFHARRVSELEKTSPHNHDFWEAFWVESGSARHVLNGRAHEVGRGDACLLRPSDAHFFEADAPFRLINVAWPVADWERWLELAGLGAGEATPAIHCPELGAAFGRMNAAFAVQGAREALHLARFWGELAPQFWPASGEGDAHPPWMMRALDRFEREDGVRGGYEWLLQIAPVSPRGLHRAWTTAFGQTPSAWVGHKRLERAALLLLETSLPIRDIAARCGFENAAYFHRVWKQKHAQSPQTFRARFRTGD